MGQRKCHRFGMRGKHVPFFFCHARLIMTFVSQLFHSYEICPPNSDVVTNTLVLGLIKRAHVRESVLTASGTVDPAKLRAVSRLGGDMYARIGEGFELSRPPWKVIRNQVISGASESE